MTDGILRKIAYEGDFETFFEVAKDALALGGALLWRDGKGLIIEPDGTRKIKVDVETFKITYE